MPAGASLCPGFVGIPVLPVLLPHPADRCRHSQCRCSQSPRSGARVLTDSLYHVPDLPRNEGGMGVLKDQAFLSWMFDPSLVLVGSAAVLHVDGVAQINFVFQQVGNGTV